jgi:hypothetical protein
VARAVSVRWMGCTWTVRIASTVQSEKRGFLSSDWLLCFLLFFLPNYQCYGHNHGIVCSNDPILCKSVRLGMTNNVAEGSFHFFCTKNSFFIF